MDLRAGGGPETTASGPVEEFGGVLPEVHPSARKARALRICLLALVGFGPLLWLDTFTLALHESVKSQLWLRDFLDPVRDYGGLFGEALILAMAYALDPRRRRGIVAAAVGVAITNLLTQALKISVARFRPEVGAGTFAFDVPWMRIFNDERRSFPSGHTSSAFALSVFLAALYPRGRWGFYLIAAGCAVTRVLDARHFPTDVYGGALLGTVIARWVIARERRSCGAPATGS
jgi:membrane-associated phospholipid phosphatase